MARACECLSDLRACLTPQMRRARPLPNARRLHLELDGGCQLRELPRDAAMIATLQREDDPADRQYDGEAKYDPPHRDTLGRWSTQQEQEQGTAVSQLPERQHDQADRADGRTDRHDDDPQRQQPAQACPQQHPRALAVLEAKQLYAQEQINQA